jgi:hypothetical protein
MRNTNGALDMAAIDDLSEWHFWDLVRACHDLNQEEQAARKRAQEG